EPIGDYLGIAEGLRADRNRAVLQQLIGQLEYIGDRLVNDQDRTPYQIWVRHLLTPAANELGWQAKPGESDEQESLRSQLMTVLGYTAGDQEIQATARKLTEQVLQDPLSVDRELAFPSFQVAAFNGDEALYNRIVEHLKG